MQALELKDFGQLAVVDRKNPTAGPGQVLIDVVATGICGSDIHGYTGENGRRHPGQVMGHESVGRIAALGPGTENGGLVLGQPVTFNPLISCTKCEACRAGQQQHCPERTVIGVDPSIVSAFAQQLAVPAANVVPLSPGTPIVYGALIEPLAVAFHAVRRARVHTGQKVLVIGGGPIGQSVILAALQEGAAQVLVSEMDPERRALCALLGATPLDPSTAPLEEQVRAAFGSLADTTVDAVGIKPTIACALAATRFGGVVSLVGMGSPELVINAYRVSTEEREIVGSFCYTNQDFRDAAAWVDQGSPVLAELITREVSMEDANAAFAGLAAADGTPGKVLVRLDSSRNSQ
ncbi:alcohol dehydrogenase catalytic domain-containing protein [Paenarthrobacter sp. DKR-5]|uniref:zinc-dependent alcohol dehydrogenase n=1 Tax=Paenarthrobacter sp. DKR-5 TaxID=2835535 RepID=UPI001BDBC7D4|nr:alcohol dehydrogenase catalytic domain-containing protein [Paenarthrobacter sp. DKR-5]MBT1001537.1 alcohol dehydrogenase catalytic domain-containing protein [Paenarthrobacter sp. DKR-5]